MGPGPLTHKTSGKTTSPMRPKKLRAGRKHWQTHDIRTTDRCSWDWCEGVARDKPNFRISSQSRDPFSLSDGKLAKRHQFSSCLGSGPSPILRTHPFWPSSSTSDFSVPWPLRAGLVCMRPRRITDLPILALPNHGT